MTQILKRRVILDSEADSLTPTLIHCIVCRDIDTAEIFKFRPNSPTGGHNDFKEEFIKFAETVELWIGHNLIGYDMPHINRLLGQEVIKPDKVLDTLVLSRLFRPSPPLQDCHGFYNRAYGHSLEAWGKYLGCFKTEFHDWEKFSEKMLEYCVQDTFVCLKIFFELWNKERIGFSEECILLEHKVARMLWQQEQDGFYLDKIKVKQLENETSVLLKEMDAKLRTLFPPIFKLDRNLPKKLNKDGSFGSVFQRIYDTYTTRSDLKAIEKEDGSYDLYQKIEFNPQSTKHIAERLLSLGWSPRNYTDKGNIKTDKVTLSNAITELLADKPHLEALRCLSDYSIVADRNQKAIKWQELANQDEWNRDGRVHGRVNPIGAGTHRCSHYDDNMANIARVSTGKLKLEELAYPKDIQKFDHFDSNKVFLKANDKEIEFALTGLSGAYGWDSRDCWTVPTKDHCLVGADASGIQLRALAHYMNDPDYTKKLLESDIHVVHQHAADISTRNKAKTFIYAWLLGGGDEKIGSIVGVTEEEYDELFNFARNRKKWNKTLLEYFISNLRDKGRKADKKTVATIIKGFKTKEQFLERTPALKRLKKEDIPKATKKGYLIGLDGRKLWIPNEHLAMSLYLQGFEAVIMKKAMQLYQEELRSKNIPFKQVAMIHDEYQIETLREYGSVVGQAVVNGIRNAGALYNSNCPLDGEFKVGNTWAETH